MMKYVATILLLLAVSVQAQNFILSEGTIARFFIDEVLFGRDTTVEGVTPLVTGEVTFDLTNPQAAQVSVISIDARDFTTDDNQRNNQVRGRILRANQDDTRFITFEPMTLNGLPEQVAVGDTFTFEITGNLTIAGLTREETFTTTVTVMDEDRLEGSASTIVRHADYNLSIPSVPFVARVEDEVILEIVFVLTGN
jgi:polyisoprenoid-binding protein YceI